MKPWKAWFLPYPNGPVTDVVGGAVGIDGAGVTGLGGGSVGLDCVSGVGGDDFGVVVDDDEDRKTHEPEPIHSSEEQVKNGHSFTIVRLNKQLN